MLLAKSELLAELSAQLESLNPGAGAKAAFELPKVASHGDLACTSAMQLAKPLGKNPRALGEQLRESLMSSPAFQKWVNSIEIAGPGFLNITLTPAAKQSVLAQIFETKEKFGQQNTIKIKQNSHNLGTAGNWNTLFKKATGKYWLKLDGDDLIKPNFLTETVKIAEHYQTDFTGTSFESLNLDNGKKKTPYIHKFLTEGLIENPIQSIFVDHPFHLCFTLLRADFIKTLMINGEYFIDTDPGIGNATPVALNQGAIIDEILAANADKVAEYKSGKDKLFGFFVGSVIKESKGKANPALVNDILKKKLS